MHNRALEVQIFAFPVKALVRPVAHIRVHKSDGTTLFCEYLGSVGRCYVTDRDMNFHMKSAAENLGCPSRNILLDSIDTHSNQVVRACTMKLAGFDYEIIRKWEDGCRRRILYWNTFISSYQGYLKVWQPK